MNLGPYCDSLSNTFKLVGCNKFCRGRLSIPPSQACCPGCDIKCSNGSRLITSDAPRSGAGSSEFLMGLRSCLIMVVVVVLAVTVSGIGLENEIPDASSPEVYQIDYRGPETHSLLPPPRRSGPKSMPSWNYVDHADMKAIHG